MLFPSSQVLEGSRTVKKKVTIWRATGKIQADCPIDGVETVKASGRRPRKHSKHLAAATRKMKENGVLDWGGGKPTLIIEE